MTKKCLPLIIAVSAALGCGQSIPGQTKPAAGSYLWSSRLGGVETQTISHIADAQSGDIVVAGSASGTLTFADSPPLVSQGSDDILIARCTDKGFYQWVRRFGGTSLHQLAGLTTDASGATIITGNFVGGTLDLGRGPVDSPRDTVFVAKYDAAGIPLWSNLYPAGGPSRFNSVAVDHRDGSIIIVGEYENYLDLGDGPVGSDESGIIVAKLSPGGVLRWKKRFESSEHQRARSVAIDTNGNIFVAGEFDDASINLGGPPLLNAGATDVFLAKLSPSGEHLWSRSIGGANVESVVGVSLDHQANVVLLGGFAGTVNFAGHQIASAGMSDTMLASFSAQGVPRWIARFGGPADDSANAIAVAEHGDGDIVIAGDMHKSLDLGERLVSVGESDAFVARLSPTGEPIWAHRFGGLDKDYANAVVITAAREVLLGGVFSAIIDLGGAQYVSAGDLDAFILKLAL